MIQRLRDEKGFTLIELMIVIAIIGILAAIAIPNFIAYRDKAFCSAAESDAGSLAAAIADYYSIPAHTALLTEGDQAFVPPVNTYAITGTVDAIIITVDDVSGRCPPAYRTAQAQVGTGDGWVGQAYVKNMQ